MSGARPEEVHELAGRPWYETNSSLGHWHSWDSPVGLGLFFISIAVAVVIVLGGVHYAFH